MGEALGIALKVALTNFRKRINFALKLGFNRALKGLIRPYETQNGIQGQSHLNHNNHGEGRPPSLLFVYWLRPLKALFAFLFALVFKLTNQGQRIILILTTNLNKMG